MDNSNSVTFSAHLPGERQSWGASAQRRHQKPSTNFDKVLAWAIKSQGVLCPYCKDEPLTFDDDATLAMNARSSCYFCEQRCMPTETVLVRAINEPVALRVAEANAAQADAEGPPASKKKLTFAAEDAPPAKKAKKKKAEETKDDAKKWAVGDLVDVLWEGGADWYPGQITRARRDGTYDVKYDDGDKEQKVFGGLIRAQQPAGAPAQV